MDQRNEIIIRLNSSEPLNVLTIINAVNRRAPEAREMLQQVLAPGITFMLRRYLAVPPENIPDLTTHCLGLIAIEAFALAELNSDELAKISLRCVRRVIRGEVNRCFFRIIPWGSSN